MKIAFISNPNSTHTRRWVDWFKRRGHQVMVIADTLLSEPWEGMEIWNLPEGFNLPVIKYLAWGWQTRRILAAWRPDILHAHRVTAGGWVAALSGFSPLVVTPWGSDLYQYPQRSSLAKWLTRWVMGKADLATADSKDLRRLAVYYGANSENTHVIQWGVDRNLFFPAPSRERLKEEWGLAKRIVLYSPRNMHPLYNLDVILQAAPSIIKHFPSVVFVLRDLNSDTVYRQQIFDMIRVMGLEDHTRVIGPMRWEQTIPLYQMADLVISVPSSDGTPVSVLEAMACGAPVIASDLPSLREWINHQENGLLVPARDAHELEAAVISALSATKLVQKFSQINLDIIASRADHELEMKKMESLYQTLLPEEISRQAVAE